MTAKVLTIKLEWENQVMFKMTEKANSSPIDVQIIKVEENACINEIWGPIQSACQAFFSKKLNEIGNEMKKP